MASLYVSDELLDQAIVAAFYCSQYALRHRTYEEWLASSDTETIRWFQRMASGAASCAAGGAITQERERTAALCRSQAARSQGDYLVPEALMEVEEAILEGWDELET